MPVGVTRTCTSAPWPTTVPSGVVRVVRRGTTPAARAVTLTLTVARLCGPIRRIDGWLSIWSRGLDASTVSLTFSTGTSRSLVTVIWSRPESARKLIVPALTLTAVVVCRVAALTRPFRVFQAVGAERQRVGRLLGGPGPGARELVAVVADLGHPADGAQGLLERSRAGGGQHRLADAGGGGGGAGDRRSLRGGLRRAAASWARWWSRREPRQGLDDVEEAPGRLGVGVEGAGRHDETDRPAVPG